MCTNRILHVCIYMLCTYEYIFRVPSLVIFTNPGYEY